MGHLIKDSFSGFGTELWRGIRRNTAEILEDAAFNERVIGIRTATAALYEAGIEDEKIVYLLQKYWDLRLSEAMEILRQEKYSDKK